MGDRTENGIERGIQIFPEIFCQKTKDVTAAFLEQGILAPVTAVNHGVG
jgi:hypothetical protein